VPVTRGTRAVADGVLTVQLATRLFDVSIEAVDGEAPIWDKDVRFFCVKQDGKAKAHFYLDPYSRPAEKRGGAWMDEVVGQSKLVCALLCHAFSCCVVRACASLPLPPFAQREASPSRCCAVPGVTTRLLLHSVL
jgi:hypothetical protein